MQSRLGLHLVSLPQVSPNPVCHLSSLEPLPPACHVQVFLLEFNTRIIFGGKHRNPSHMWRIRSMVKFLRTGVVNTSPNVQVGGPPPYRTCATIYSICFQLPSVASFFWVKRRRQFLRSICTVSGL